MKKFRADLHLHTVLSPCADLEMSPDQIVARAIRQGLDIIAVTDHNSTRQCSVVRKIAEQAGLVVINGCEVNSREEVHAICLFEDDYSRNEFQHFLDHYLPPIPNKPEYLGYQVVVDEQNNILEQLPYYLGNGLDVSLDVIEQYTHELNGLFIPAHIDRPINSIFSQLGFLPNDLNVDALQISKRTQEADIRKQYDIHREVTLIKASDAHYPEDIGSAYTVFYLNQPDFREIRWALQQKNGRMAKIEA